MDTQNQSAVLMLNLPPASFGGIDLLSFTTAPRFQGIKQLPPGWHFAFVSPSASVSVRHGAWFYVVGSSNSSSNQAGVGDSAPEIFVKKWDANTESFIAETDEAAILSWRANIGSIWRDGLSPYRQSAGQQQSEKSKDEEEGGKVGEGKEPKTKGKERAQPEPAAVEERNDWSELTKHISVALLDRITDPPTGLKNHWSLSSVSSAKRDMDVIPGLSTGDTAGIEAEKELKFLPIDLKQTWGEGITGRERTLAARDRSWALGDVVDKWCSGDESMVLGEMEFTFLMVLTLNNYSCLEQWKRILELLFTCRNAVVTERTTLFVAAIQLLKLQLQHCDDADGGLFDLSDEGASFLKQLLRKFKLGLEDVSGKGKVDVLDELEELEEFLRSEYGWQLDDSFVRKGILELEDGEQVEMDVAGYEEEDESGEYAPTIVELTPEQLRALSTVDGSIESVTPKRLLQQQQQHQQQQKQHYVEQDEDMEEDDRDIDEMDARY